MNNLSPTLEDTRVLTQIKKIYNAELNNVFWCEQDGNFYHWDNCYVLPVKQVSIKRTYKTKEGDKNVEYNYWYLPLKYPLANLNPTYRIGKREWNTIKNKFRIVIYGGEGSIFDIPQNNLKPNEAYKEWCDFYKKYRNDETERMTVNKVYYSNAHGEENLDEVLERLKVEGDLETKMKEAREEAKRIQRELWWEEREKYYN
jgi:hypothetical protein